MARRQERAAPFAPKFFTAHEWATVRLLADIVIPKDERSGSATDALVPEFMDFTMTTPDRGARPRAAPDRDARRPGLARPRVPGPLRQDLLAGGEGERTQVLDDIAYPEKAKGRPS